MPLFEYMCHDCSENFETLVLKGDDPVSCPKCSSSDVHKMLSVCGFKTAGKGGVPQEVFSGSSHSHSAGCSCGCGGLSPRVVQKKE